jgi:flavin reductase (DIM6/NTAB) family NADH-FMN oxidoreductase RutF
MGSRSEGSMIDSRNSPEHSGLQVEREAFITSMAAFPTGVTIVTTLDRDGIARGLTCNAFMSVSAEPPLVLVSVDKASNTLPALRRVGRFVVNFLAAGREELALHCASKLDDKFMAVKWRPSDQHGLPVLHEDSIAHLRCDLVREIEAGDHVLLLGHVQEVSPPDPGAVPLLYFQRAYDSWPVTS